MGFFSSSSSSPKSMTFLGVSIAMLNVCFAIEKESNDAGEFSRVEKIYERNNEFFFSLFLRDNGLIESDKQTNVPCSQERRVNCKI